MGGFYDHSQTLVELINSHKVEKFAEIGVWKGKTERYILRTNPPTLKFYYGIDQYKLLDSRHGHMGNLTMADWDALYWRVCWDMYWFEQFRIMRLSSVEASKFFPDQWFDMVFIDGSHFREDVESDIHAWYDKVRVGGLVTGHDYGSSRHIEVAPMVDKIFGKENLTILKGKVWVYEKKTAGTINI